MSAQTLKVLGSFLSDPRAELSGADIARMTKLASGTLYPILLRLEGAGWFASRWEKANPADLGRPRRRLYRMTALGAKRAKQELRALQTLVGGVAWA
jgi:PadR family transcriptional regulator PadR